jgi:hypothetical protein
VIINNLSNFSRSLSALRRASLYQVKMSPSNEKPRVLLTGEIDWAQDEWNALSDVATLEVMSQQQTDN